jgi:GNAT superfamily N-acetyltransferase
LKPLDECHLRPAAAADVDYLFTLFLSERQRQFAHVAWSEEQTRQLLRMQFEAQRRHYGKQFPGAVHSIVLWNGVAAGQLYLDRQKEQFVVVDFALAPDFRRLGIGSKRMRRRQGCESPARSTVPIRQRSFGKVWDFTSLEKIASISRWSGVLSYSTRMAVMGSTRRARQVGHRLPAKVVPRATVNPEA